MRRFPSFYVSALLLCPVNLTLISLSFLHIQWPKHPFHIPFLTSRQTKHHTWTCARTCALETTLVFHSNTIVKHSFLYIAKWDCRRLTHCLPLSFPFYSQISVAYLSLSHQQIQHHPINKHCLASHHKIIAGNRCPVSPSSRVRFSFSLLCLNDPEPATLLSPSKSFAIPYVPSFRRHLTLF